MTRYSAHVASPLSTPQNVRARKDQVENNAGGFVFQLDCWKRLDRFLILGCDGPTYYASEKAHSVQASEAVKECIESDGPRTVARIVEISDAGRAIKNDPAIFALAMCAGATNEATRRAALAAIPKVYRIGTHLFHFAEDVEKFRRWGRSLRTAVGGWYNAQKPDALALQVIKYQQRDGWSHKDVLRLSHPKPATPEHRAILRYVQLGAGEMGKVREGKRDKDPITADKLPAIIQAFEEIHSEGVDKKRAVDLIATHKLPHECVPNELKGDPKIWEAMLPSMGITALIRNLGKLSSIGMTKGLSSTTKDLASRISDAAILKKGRVHPMTILYAMKTYASGHGLKGSLSWDPERMIVDALDEAFYLSFGNIESAGKATMLALDISGSMSSSMGGTNVSCREASSAMAMVTARTEKNWMCVGFTSGGGGYGGRWDAGRNGLTKIDISPRQRLDDICKKTDALPMGGTDCALPMVYATQEKLEVDVFTVYTDSETWAGSIQPFQALQQYRQKSGRNAKLIVVGMTATEFSIADPRDAGMLDVVGFDTSTPNAMAEFARG